MSTTLLRLGLWTLILVLVLYVLATTYQEQDWAELIPMPMLQQALVVSGALILLGIVARMFDKGARVVAKNRCRVCRKAVPSGALFCREHLRTMLAEEDQKTHMTRLRR
jgi:predicted nucleic acid-binding Zn ribbon protein